jgi:PKD repeat protein
MRKLLLMFIAALLFAVSNSGLNNSASAQSVTYSYSGVCMNSPTTFSGSVTGTTAVSWSWDFGDGTFGAGQNVSHTYTASNITPGYAAKLTVVDNLGATYTNTKFISVQDLPTVFFNFITPTCSSDSVYFHDLSFTTYGYKLRYVWNFNDGSPNDTIYYPNNPDIGHLFPAFGTYNVTLEVMNSDSCVNSTTLAVTIIPSPIANFYFTNGCEDQDVQFTDASAPNGPGNVVYWSWNFGDPTSGVNDTSTIQNPQHRYNNPGTYTVVLKATNFNNCADTMTKQIVIYPHPPVDFTHGPSCLNSETWFYTDPTVANIGALQNWHWDFGDGGIMTAVNNPDISHVYTVPGTYTVILTVTDTNGCINTLSKLITINPLPIAHFDAGASNCAGSSVMFNDLSNTQGPTSGYIVRWEWDFGDGNTAVRIHPQDPDTIHTYLAAGTYAVTLRVVASDSCSNTETQNITIHPNPVANFIATPPTCFGSIVSFKDLSAPGGGGTINAWDWNFGDFASGIANTATTPNPDHTFSASGTFTVTLIVTTSNGCTDTLQKQITVDPKPAVNFTSTYNCQNNDVWFDPDPLVMNFPSIATYYWDFGDGTNVTMNSSATAIKVYPAAGNYLVTLTVTDTKGCMNSIQKLVTIMPQPSANFSVSTPACKQSVVTFSNLSSASGAYIVKSDWKFGDGGFLSVSNLADVTHTYTNSGIFNVSLTVTTNDSCKRTFTQQITIANNPLSDFSFLTTCINSPVQFNDISQPGQGAIASWYWNFGDPPSGANNTAAVPDPTHTFTSAGNFPVLLITTNTAGCQDSVVKQVNVHPLPTVDFSISPGCVNDSTHFVSSTFVSAGAIVSRVWDFGDGFTATNIADPYHTYATSGTFPVTLTITDTAGCINTKTRMVSIVPPPVSVFQVSAQTCANNPVFFTDQSYTAGGTIATYTWDFGDGTTQVINAPLPGNATHTYLVAGNMTVKLKIRTTLGCEAESQKNITVSASPLAQFSYSNTCEDAAVSFNDLSTVNSGTAIVSWLWDFGDPASGVNNSSLLQNPLHVYNTPGNHIVTLLVENGTGCPDTVSKTVVVRPKPGVEFTWLNTCIGTTTNFTTNTTVTNIGAVSTYEWNFGDGTPTSNQQNPVHTYLVPGSFNVSLTITDTAGCVNTIIHPVVMTPQPVAIFSYTPACQGASTFFTDQSFTLDGELINKWHWDFGVASATNDTSNQQNPVWIYTTTGVYTVNLLVTTQSGCVDTASVTVQVYGRPSAGFTYTTVPCDNGAVYFQDSSFAQQGNIIGWNWEFQPNQYSTLQNPVYVYYYSDSCYNVRLIATDNRGCVDTTYKNVCVPATFDFTFSAPTTCLRDTTFFIPQILSPATDSLTFFNWNFGEPGSGINNTSTLKYPNHVYSAPGIYTIELSSTDIYNCNKKVYKTVNILPLPVPAFSFTEGLCDSTIYFNESSTGSGSNLIKWVWNYGDGTSDTIVPPLSADTSHKYLAAGVYSVSLTVTNGNGCTETFVNSNLLVKPCINAQISVIDTLICQNNMLTFADSSYSGIPATEWYWNFGDGSDTTYFVGTNPISHVYTQPGTYLVKMIISTDVAGNKVSDSVVMAVEVIPTPLPEFKYNKVCDQKSAIFTNMTSGNGTSISNYMWTFGEPASAPNDTSTLKHPEHLYAVPGTYDVKLVTKNTLGCTDSIQKTLTVYGLPDANYEYDRSCAGNKTQFGDLSVVAIAPLTGWQWTFSRTATEVLGMSDQQNPEFTFDFPGDYLVNLMVSDTNGCIDTINKTVTTWSVPSSIFTYTDNFNDVQGQVSFANMSFDASRFYWSFGNGDESYAMNPVVFYQNDGKYPITLITWNDHDCSDTITMEYTFMVKGLYIPNAFSPGNPKEEVQLLKPVGINLKEYRFEVYDRWGNMLWWSDKLDANGRPTEGWDGKYNGELMQEGVYMWRATAIFKDDTIWEAENLGNNDNLPKSKKGTATMIR